MWRAAGSPLPAVKGGACRASPLPKPPTIPLRLCVRNYEVRRMISGLGGVDFGESVLL